jgi:hypothetical protein
VDPTANLAEQREIQARLSEGEYENLEEQLNDYGRLADLAESLDNWCANGGFRPSQWKHNLPFGK